MKKGISIEDFAEKRGLSVDDVLCLAEDEEINLSVYWSGFYNEYFPGQSPREYGPNRGPLNDYVKLPKIYAEKLLNLSYEQRTVNHGAIEIGRCYLENGQQIHIFIKIPENPGVEYDPLFTSDDLRITEEEANLYDDKMNNR